MPYYLSDKTYGDLERVIAERDGPTAGNSLSGGTRQILHVRITSDTADADGFYTCTPCAYVPATDSWESYTTDAKCKEPNGAPLVNGARYIAIRYGLDEAGTPTFLTDRIVSIKYPLGNPCFVKDGYGNIVGIAQRWVQPDGNVECKVTDSDCGGDGCSSSSVSPSPPPPPPSPPVTPPDPTPTSFDVFVLVYENHAVDGICGAGTQPGTYSVTVAGSTQGTQVVPSGGIWFTGCPWGNDTAAVLSYGGSDTVEWFSGAFGCGGSGSTGFGNTAPLNGSFCGELGVSFTVGNCGGTPLPARTDITVEKIIE